MSLEQSQELAALEARINSTQRKLKEQNGFLPFLEQVHAANLVATTKNTIDELEKELVHMREKVTKLTNGGNSQMPTDTAVIQNIVSRVQNNIYAEQIATQSADIPFVQIGTTAQPFNEADAQVTSVGSITSSHKSLHQQLSELNMNVAAEGHHLQMLEAQQATPWDQNDSAAAAIFETRAMEIYCKHQYIQGLHRQHAQYTAQLANETGLQNHISHGRSNLDGKYAKRAAQLAALNELQRDIEREEQAMNARQTVSMSTNTPQHTPAPMNTTTVHSITTTTIQVNNTNLHPTVISTPIDRRNDRFRTFMPAHPATFAIGDIGWYPILRPTILPRPSDMSTKFGLICAKFNPVIIVEKLSECAIALVISTSGGQGLLSLPQPMQRRCTRVVSEKASYIPTMPAGTILLPPRVLSVVDQRDAFTGRAVGYVPDLNAHVNMLETVKVHYDTRFMKEGALTAASANHVVSMRASVMLERNRMMMGDDALGKLLRAVGGMMITSL